MFCTQYFKRQKLNLSKWRHYFSFSKSELKLLNWLIFGNIWLLVSLIHKSSFIIKPIKCKHPNRKRHIWKQFTLHSPQSQSTERTKVKKRVCILQHSSQCSCNFNYMFSICSVLLYQNEIVYSLFWLFFFKWLSP